MSAVLGFKRAAAWGLVHSGALALHRRLKSEKRAIVLMYHRVNDDRDPFFPSLPSQTFREQIEYVARNYRCEPLVDVLDWLRDDDLSGPPRVAVTVDDGYPDTYHTLLPELQRVGVPATVFLATSPPETGRALWTDRVRHLFKAATAKHIRTPLLGEETYPLEAELDRRRALKKLMGEMKKLAPDALNSLMGTLESELEPNGSEPSVLDWDQVRAMCHHGPIFLGAHTHEHYMVSRLSSSRLFEEIGTSVRLIERECGVRVRSFAYPNGEAEDFDDRSFAVLKTLGVDYAVTTENGFVRPKTDPYQLPRVYTSEPSVPLFAARLDGFSREFA